MFLLLGFLGSLGFGEIGDLLCRFLRGGTRGSLCLALGCFISRFRRIRALLIRRVATISLSVLLDWLGGLRMLVRTVVVYKLWYMFS
jgi:hypothetical protein